MTAPAPRITERALLLLLLLLRRPAAARAFASWGSCSGNSLSCLTTDRSTCLSVNEDGDHDRVFDRDRNRWAEVECRWFDYTGLIVGLAFMGALSIVLAALLFMVTRRLGRVEAVVQRLGALQTAPNDDGGGDGNDDGGLESPLMGIMEKDPATMTYNEKIKAKKKLKKEAEGRV